MEAKTGEKAAINKGVKLATINQIFNNKAAKIKLPTCDLIKLKKQE